MEEIVIQVEDKQKADLLMNILKSIEFVTFVSFENKYKAKLNLTYEKEKDFFALSGLWKDRDISVNSIRKKAWPRQ